MNLATTVFVGNLGSGVFNQNGGMVKITGVNGYLDLAASTGSSGTYNLAAGTLQIDQTFTLADAANATFNQSGGTATIGQRLIISNAASILGTYNMTNGSLSAAEIDVGQAGIGLFNQTNGTVVTPRLNLASSDIGRSAVIVDPGGIPPSPLSDIRAAIIAGRTTGVGILSSAIASNPNLAIGYAPASTLSGGDGGTFLGETVSGSAILVRTTFAGDADLNGQVGFSDLVAVAQHYGLEGSGQWITGDFNYDGNVGFADLVAVAQNYGGALDFPAIPGAPAQFNEDVAGAFAQVPEPSSIALVLLANGYILRTKRSRKRIACTTT